MNPDPGQLAQPRRWKPASKPRRRGSTTSNETSKTGGVMKVAFATQDLKRVDAHFGWAKNIAIYEVTPEGHSLRRDRSSSPAISRRTATRTSCSPRSTPSRIAPFFMSPRSAARARPASSRSNIHPMKVKQPEEISDLLDKLQRRAQRLAAAVAAQGHGQRTGTQNSNSKKRFEPCLTQQPSRRAPRSTRPSSRS